MKTLEVLSPAGDINNLKIAIKSGADAVYFGLNKFNARMKADNISLDILKSIVDYAHLKGVKMYLTINTLVSDSELRELIDIVGSCLECGVDAFIVQDYGVIGVLKSVYPNIVLHGSTQLGVHNVRGARVAKKLGLSRVVLSREVTLEDIEEISKNVDIELEVFVQGAMCVCFSGNCYLSSLKFGASGNRGLCKQLCRLPYTLSNDNLKKSGYILSPRDNCMLDYLDKLSELGVSSFKIEGRLRRAGYVATATRIYRQAIDSIICRKSYNKIQAKSELKKIFSRGEFICGYFDNKNIIDTTHNNHIGEKIGKVIRCDKFKDLFKITIKSNIEINSGDGLKFLGCNKEITLGVGNVEKSAGNYVVFGKNYVDVGLDVYRVLDSQFENNVIDFSKRRPLNMKINVVVGRPLELVVTSEKVQIRVSGDVVGLAENKPITIEKIRENLGKIDRDIFELSSIEFESFDEKAFVSISSINELRRSAVSAITEAILSNEKIDIVRNNIPEILATDNKYNSLAIVDEDCNISSLATKYDSLILSPKNYSVGVIKKFLLSYRKYFKNETLIINLPIIALTPDLKKIDEIVNFAIDNDLMLFANNIYALDYIDSGAKIICSHNMNVANNYSVTTLKKLGTNDIVFSCEKWTSRITGTYKLATGKRVLMTFAHCPNVTLCGSGCENVMCNNNSNNACKYTSTLKLTDNKNKYTIRKYRVHNCYFELVDEFREDSATNNIVDDLRN